MIGESSTARPSPSRRAMGLLARGLGYAAGLFLLLLITFLALRVSPLLAFKALWTGAFGDAETGHWDAISETLVESTPLLLTGLSVVMAWRAGMFSIGAEGQLLMGALAASWVATLGSALPSPLLMLLMLGVGMSAGAGWGAIAGWLRVRRNIQEVISTIMLNYIALSLVGWAALGPLHGKTQSGPHTDPLPEKLMLPPMLPIQWAGFQTRLHWGALLAFLAVPLLFVLLYRTAAGHGLRVLGQNPEAARVARYPIQRLRMQAMLASGGLCGLAGAIQLMGINGKMGTDFSPGWGYTAVPVALLGGLHPMGAMFSALFFGALGAGCDNAQRSSAVGVPSVVSYVIQAATVLAIVGVRAWQFRRTGTETD